MVQILVCPEFGLFAQRKRAFFDGGGTREGVHLVKETRYAVSRKPAVHDRSPLYARRGDVEDACCSALFFGAPSLRRHLLGDRIPLTACVGRLVVDRLAVQAHVDGDGNGELEVLRVVLGAAMVLVPSSVNGVGKGTMVWHRERTMPARSKDPGGTRA
jgi:hypothetical protein